MSFVINAMIFLITAIVIVSVFRKDGRWDMNAGRSALRYYTQLSNVLCGIAALMMCLFPSSNAAWLFKYVGTAALMVTMLTVFLYLGPAIGSLKPLLSGGSFFFHLVDPLLALVSFVLLERRGLRFGTALIGMLPVVLYGVWYLYKVVLAPEQKRWDDLYGFNKQGKWPISFAIMMAGGFAVCMVLMLLQNI